MAFAKDCAAQVAPAYVPLVVKHKDDKFTPEQKKWQQVRPGRGQGGGPAVYEMKTRQGVFDCQAFAM